MAQMLSFTKNSHVHPLSLLQCPAGSAVPACLQCWEAGESTTQVGTWRCNSLPGGERPLTSSGLCVNTPPTKGKAGSRGHSPRPQLEAGFLQAIVWHKSLHRKLPNSLKGQYFMSIHFVSLLPSRAKVCLLSKLFSYLCQVGASLRQKSALN